ELVGRWTGQLNGGQIVGRAEFQKLEVMGTTAAGVVSVKQQAQTIVLRPEQFKLGAEGLPTPTTAQVAVADNRIASHVAAEVSVWTRMRSADKLATLVQGADIRLVNGAIVVAADGIRADDLQLSVGGGVARISGKWSLGGNAVDGQIKAEWREVSLPKGVT